VSPQTEALALRQQSRVLLSGLWGKLNVWLPLGFLGEYTHTPLIILSTAEGSQDHAHQLKRVTLLPHRERAWSGVAIPVPAGVTTLQVTFVLPPQAQAGTVLYVDNVFLSR
jgi:hypothetical protein